MLNVEKLSCPPRVCSVPRRAGTLGPRAVELAAEAGLELDDWQAWSLQEALGVRPDGRWSSFEVGLCVPRQDGKGSILEARELAGLFLPEIFERLLTHTAHEFKTSQEHFLRLVTRVESLPPRYRRQVKQVREAHGHEAIEMRDGRRLRFLARSGGSGRGFSGDFVALDESMILLAGAVGALLPTMAARANVTVGGPQLWYAGSAGLGTDKSDVFARVRDRGIAGAERLFWAEWSAGAADNHVGAQIDLDDRAEWYRANPAMHGDRPRITEEFVENERAGMPSDDEFARERLCLWGVDAGQAVISADTWRALVEQRASTAGKKAFAVDIPPEGQAASLGRAVERDDGTILVEVDRRQGTLWAQERLIELYRKRRAPVVLDPGTRAGALLAGLVEGRVKPRTVTARELTAACERFVQLVDEGKIRHAGQPELAVAVDAARKRRVGDAWAWHRRDASVDISPLVAATLAVYGLNFAGRKRTGGAMAV